MRNITVIGAGIGGFTLIEKIRAKNVGVKITLIDKNTHHFCKQELILSPGELGKRVDLEEWAKEKNVEFINDTVERINLRRKKIYLKQGEAQEFDRLVVATGLSSKKLPIKGEHREGFFYLSNLEPVSLKDLLRISGEACVYVSSLLGLQFALSLVGLGKEVRIVSTNLDFLGQHKERVMNYLGEKGILIHLESSIEEAVGEGMVKAVKISPLKVFSSQLVFIDSGFIPNLNFFEDEVVVRDTFFTNHQDLYFVGDVARSDIESEILFTNNYEETLSQASCFCDYLIEEKTPAFERKSSGQEDWQKAIDSLLGEKSQQVESI